MAKESNESFVGRQFELDGDVFTIDAQARDARDIIVWFENDGTKWIYLSEIFDLLLPAENK